MSTVEYCDRAPHYKHFTREEWNLKYSYSYDDQKSFSDIKLFDMQNNHRLYSMMVDFGLPGNSSSVCTAFSANNQRNSLIQRYLCRNSCFWDPQKCLFEDTHSGNLSDLMHEDFHNNFNPLFEKQFDRMFLDKIDWTTAGGRGYYPSMGVNRIIEEMGITTKLTYGSDGCAVNFVNLCREYRDSIPVRPLYVMEEKKCHDVIEALFNVNHEHINIAKKDIEKNYDESYRGNGTYRSPILSLFMWGPNIEYKLQKTDQECNLENIQSESHVCTNFSDKNYWMYTHSARVPCKKGTLENLEGPVMNLDLRVVYPCNRAGCNEDCLCELCTNVDKCPKSEHKRHLKDIAAECMVKKMSYCQEHQVNHPENCKEEEDISIKKNIFYHNLKLVKQPRSHCTDKINLAGIKKNCKACRLNVENHFKYHKVIHLQCKFCVYQMKTTLDKNFWDKVCHICGKVFSNARTLKYWHKKVHSSDWNCNECDIKFTRKWTLRRHLLEIHGMNLNDVDCDSEDDPDEQNTLCMDNDSDIKEEETDSEEDCSDIDDNVDHNGKQVICDVCDKEFAIQRYLDTHMKSNHSQKQSFQCDECKTNFTLKENLRRHKQTVHVQQRTDSLNMTDVQRSYTCNECGTHFTRIDNLNRHIQLAQTKEMEKFECQHCGKKFDRKWNLKRHEEQCYLSFTHVLNE